MIKCTIDVYIRVELTDREEEKLAREINEFVKEKVKTDYCGIDYTYPKNKKGSSEKEEPSSIYVLPVLT